MSIFRIKRKLAACAAVAASLALLPSGGCSDPLEQGYYPAAENSLLLRVTSGTNMNLGSYNALTAVEIESNTEWTLTAEAGGAGVSWIHLGTDNKASVAGKGSQSVMITADANTGDTERSCTLVLSGPENLKETVKVTQTGTDLIVNPSPEQIITLPATGGTQTYSVSSNFEWRATVEVGADWLTIESPQGGAGAPGETELTVSCQPTALAADRVARIVLSPVSAELASAVTLNLRQAARDYTFEISPSVQLQPAPWSGEQIQLSVFSTTDWNLANIDDTTSDGSWIHVSPSAAAGNAAAATVVNVMLTENLLAADGQPTTRSAVLNFRNADGEVRSIELKQEPCGVPLIGQTVADMRYDHASHSYIVEVTAGFASLYSDLTEARILYADDPNRPDSEWQSVAARISNPRRGTIEGTVTIPATDSRTRWWFKAAGRTATGIEARTMQGVLAPEVLTPAIPSADDNGTPD